MILQYLGSAAAEGWPAMFCECEACREAAKRGGKNIRLRTDALVNSEILIDCGPDLMVQKQRFDIPLYRIRDIFLTHTHSDHFNVINFQWLRQGFATVKEREKLGKIRLHCASEALGEVNRILATAENDLSELVEVLPMRFYESVTVKGVTFTALPAVHGAVAPVNYLLEQDGKRMIYAHDTGLWTDDVYEFLSGKRVDFVSMDCTNQLLSSTYTGHMGIERNKIMRERMLKMGIADEKTRFAVNHFSHNGHILHEEMVALCTPLGFEVGYDGKIVEI